MLSWASEIVERAVRRAAAGPLLALLAAPLLGSCTAQGVASNLYHNAPALQDAVERPLLVHEARNLYLLRSGDVFYPDGPVAQPAELPSLSQPAVDLIGSIMEVELQRIRDAQKAHASLLASEFPGHDPFRIPLRLVPTDNGSASAQAISKTGDVVVDVRIIQATYRAALISVFAKDDELPSYVDTPAKREAYAFNAFSRYRARLRSLRPVALQDNLTGARLGMSVLGSKRDQERALSDASALFSRALEESSTMIESRTLERAFLAAIRFVLAHEAAHIALNHPATPPSCSEALANEATADRYAVLVSDLSDYARIPGIVIARGSTRLNTTYLTPIERWVMNPSDGSSEFFGFAYALAGLDTRLRAVPGCSYPDPAQRLATVRPLANVIDWVHSQAVTDQSLRRFGAPSARRELEARPFETWFPNLPRAATEEKPFPTDLAPLRTMLSEVYYDTYRREN